MFSLAQPRTVSFFYDDVRAFLNHHEIRYAEDVKISGKSGFDHKIDFLIPKSVKQPERILKVISAPSKQYVSNYLFELTDAKDARSAEIIPIAVLNDTEKDVSAEVETALRAYEVMALCWSNRNESIDILVS
jgi:hypothetical protein